MRRILDCRTMCHALLACATMLWSALPLRASDETLFAEKLYPVFHRVQCDLCHNDNGVASETQLAFPPSDASREQITAFGLSLMDLVDRNDPEQSMLLLKPTNREEHTGGVRIKPGSDEEKLLRSWVGYLAGLTDEQVSQARQRISQAARTEPTALAVRRLTHSQYNNTVRDLLGDEIQPANGFPKEDYIRGFKNQAEAQGISPLLAEAYGKAAEQLARAAFRGGDQRGLLPGEPSSPTDRALAEKFVRQFGFKAFRRPLAEPEVRQYVELQLHEAARTNDFLAGAQLVVEAMLQSPYFLFRIERGPDSPTAQFETANRLSYFLWDTMPNEALFQTAARGELGTIEQVEGAARRMLEDPRARQSLAEFLAQWMRFDSVLGATRDRRRYGEFDAALASAMVEETRRLFDHLVWNDGNFMEFFAADYTFVNADLARLYGLPAEGDEFAKVAYPPDSGRAGVLGHGSFLVATSNPAETSPTSRGLFVRTQFLGHEVPAPPPGVNTSLPELSAERPMTNRQRLAVHLNSESCASCHRLIDPIGLGLEQYNPIGVFEKKMQIRSGGGRRGGSSKMVELEIDTTAHIQGIKNSGFSTPKELGSILAESPTAQRAIVKQLFRYALGREETEHDQPMIDQATEQFRTSGFRFRELMVALVTSQAFLGRSGN
jgi:hypothetical protein